MNPEYQNAWKTARERAGLTQEAAAELVDVSAKSIGYYESGARHMTPRSWPTPIMHRGCATCTARNVRSAVTAACRLSRLIFGKPQSARTAIFVRKKSGNGWIV